MGFWARLFSRGTVPQPDPRLYISPYPGLFVPKELRLDANEQLSLSAVWGCIRVISEAIASSPWNVFVREGGNRRKALPEDAVAWLLNRRPNPETSAQALKEGLLVQALVYGDAYAEIEFDAAGRVVGLWPLLTDRMQAQRDNVTRELIYVYRDHDGKDKPLKAAQVLHLRGLSMNGMFGETAITHAARAIATGVAAEIYAGSFYANGAQPSGVLYTEQTLKADVSKRLKADWAKRQGAKNAHKLAVLEAGLKYQQVGTDAEKSQVVASRVFTVEEVARAFGVPLVKLGVPQAATGYGTNVSQLNLAFTRDTLVPWANRLQQEVSYKLFPQRTPWREAECDLTWLTRGDAKERAEADKIRIESGVLSINEARDGEGRNDIGPAGDLHLVPGSWVELSADNMKRPVPAPSPARDPMKPTPDEKGPPDESR